MRIMAIYSGIERSEKFSDVREIPCPHVDSTPKKFLGVQEFLGPANPFSYRLAQDDYRLHRGLADIFLVVDGEA